MLSWDTIVALKHWGENITNLFYVEPVPLLLTRIEYRSCKLLIAVSTTDSETWIKSLLNTIEADQIKFGELLLIVFWSNTWTQSYKLFLA